MGALLNRRRYMGGKALPYDAEVEYLQSTGTAYIDTGITPTLSYSVEMEFKWVSPWSTADASGTLFGALNGWNTNTFMVVCTASNNNRYIYNCWGSDNSYNSNANYINGLLDNWHSLTFRNKTTYIDGTAIAGAASGTGNPIGNIYVFCANLKNTGTYGRGTTKQIRSFKLYNANSELVMDLIPVRKGTTGYMYDKISKKLFGNAGTDDFVLGNDVTKGYVYQVEYIQLNSRSSQLINTGILGDMGTDAVEVKFGNVSKANQDIFIGDNSGADTRGIRLYINSSSKYSFYYRSTSNADTWNSTNVDSANGVETTFKVDYKNGTWSIDNGTQYSGTFSCNAGNSYYNTVGSNFENRSAPAKYYYVKWWRNDVLILHAIPVVKNGTPYFYDIVNNKLINIYAAVSNITIGSIIY